MNTRIMSSIDLGSGGNLILFTYAWLRTTTGLRHCSVEMQCWDLGELACNVIGKTERIRDANLESQPCGANEQTWKHLSLTFL